MNVCLLFAYMTVLPVIIGWGVLMLLYRKNTNQFHMADYLIIGWLVAIGLAEGAHLAVVFLAWTISKAAMVWMAGFMVIAALCGGIGLLTGRTSRKNIGKTKQVHKQKRKHLDKEVTPLQAGVFLVIILSVIWQIVTIMSYESAYWAGDMMVETVESFLQTDAVYVVNPLTGREYTTGIPFRIKILGLPTLYSVLCRFFAVESAALVWRYIPLLVLFLSYSAYWLIAKELFDKEYEREKRLVFVALVSLLFCVGDYAYGMDGFGMLHCGYQGVVIRNLVLIPYTFALTLRRKWLPVVLCILAEACITWTFYGLGACLLVGAGMFGVWMWRGKRAERRWQTDDLRDERREV